jgi:hypothetical protein
MSSNDKPEDKCWKRNCCKEVYGGYFLGEDEDDVTNMCEYHKKKLHICDECCHTPEWCECESEEEDKPPVKKMAKYVLATYIAEDRFRVPSDVDLNAPNISWGVKWGKLTIYKDDEEIYEIDGDYQPEGNYDWKRPSETEVLEATDDDASEDEDS